MKIDSAHVGLHRGPDLGHDQYQCFLQSIGRVNVLNQTPKHLEHYRLLLRRPGFRGLDTSEPINCVNAWR